MSPLHVSRAIPPASGEFRDRESGVALIATLLILALLLALSAAMTTSIVSDTQLRGAYDRATAGFYAAESGLDAGMGGYRDLFLAFKVPTSSDFLAKTLTVGKRTVTYSLADRNPTPGIPTSVAIPPGQAFGGLNASQYYYTVTSAATNTSGDTEATVGAEFEVGYIPLFQFVAFYTNDLEIDPGAAMNLNGRVHTNANLYLGPDNNLTISTNPAIGVNYVQVTAGNNIERGRKDSGACNTSPTLQVSTSAGALKTLSCIGTSTAVVPQSTLTTWGGTMLSNVTRISVPEPSITARGGGTGTYWGNADLRLALILHKQWTPNILGAIPYPHKIAVLNSDGSVNDAMQTTLEKFIFQNPAPTTGTSGNMRPLFYTDAPTQGGTAGCPNCSNSTPWNCTTNTAGNATGRPACYSPAFANEPGGPPATCPGFNVSNSGRVYGMMNSAATAGCPNADSDPRHGGFYNWREGRWTYLLNINVHDLLQWNIDQGGPFFSPSDTTDGGVVLYVTVYDNNYPTTNPSPNLSPDGSANSFGFGVRIFGSSTLPFPSLASLGGDPTGLTVVSDRAIYVQGDFNDPAGGVFNPTTGWQPASIVGDAVNVLSNNYFRLGMLAVDSNNGNPCANDCQSNRSLGDGTRAATTTTINAAFLSGVDTTTAGNYNGGLENYPRFHESWSNQTFNYLGSFVSLGTPTTVTGPWCGTGGSYLGAPPTLSGCNIYNPPIRAWNFDPNFQNAAYLPPFTPRFVYVQQVRFTENFQ